jgi:hypothetical protein
VFRNWGSNKVKSRKTRGAAGVFSLAAIASTSVVIAFNFLPSDAARRPPTAIAVSPVVPSETSAPVEIGDGVQILRPFVIEGSRRELERGRKALALLRFKPEDVLPGWTIVFKPARAGILGLTLVQERRVEVYVRMDRPLAGTAHDIAHELGHAVDVTYYSDDEHLSYLELRNLAPSTSWWTCSGCRDMQVGAGDFAETFALWAAPRFRFYSELAPEPSLQVLDRFAASLPSTVTTASTNTAGSASN